MVVGDGAVTIGMGVEHCEPISISIPGLLGSKQRIRLNRDQAERLVAELVGIMAITETAFDDAPELTDEWFAKATAHRGLPDA